MSSNSVVKVKLLSVIDNSSVHAFSDAVKYLVRQEIFEKQVVVTEEQFHKIFVDVLHRMVSAESLV